MPKVRAFSPRLSTAGAAPAGAPNAADALFDSLPAYKTSLLLQASAVKDVFDLDQLNQQPAMAALLAAVDHVHRAFQKDWRPEVMPAWMEALHSKMVDADYAAADPAPGSEQPINLKWFLAKLVVNRWRVFAPYARFWFKPLVGP
jgi:hypothetical protein